MFLGRNRFVYSLLAVAASGAAAFTTPSLFSDTAAVAVAKTTRTTSPTTTLSSSLSLPIWGTRTVRPVRRRHTTMTQQWASSTSSIPQAGDTVLVVGGTGGVGQLVTQKLAANQQRKVLVTSRNPQQAQEILAIDNDNDTTNDAIRVVEVDVVNSSPEQLQNILKNVSAMVISVGTTAFPTLKWRNGNTPDAIDHLAVARLVQAAAATKSVQKIVLVTSVGVDRIQDFPFVILNLFGVLDAKKKGEEALKQAAASSSSSLDYVIVRPGRLVGGPFTNYDVATLLQIEGGAENGVDCAPGDALLGDCKRDACAEAIVQALLSEQAKNIEFSIVSNEEKKALSSSEWDTLFQSLRQQQ